MKKEEAASTVRALSQQIGRGHGGTNLGGPKRDLFTQGLSEKDSQGNRRSSEAARTCETLKKLAFNARGDLLLKLIGSGLCFIHHIGREQDSKATPVKGLPWENRLFGYDMP